MLGHVQSAGMVFWHPLMSKGRDNRTHDAASFHIRLKQHIILDTVECYLRHLVSKVTRRVYLESTKLRQKREKSANNLDGAITISQSQIVKIKTPHLLTVEGERMLKNNHPAHSAPLLTLASFSILWRYWFMWYSRGLTQPGRFRENTDVNERRWGFSFCLFVLYVELLSYGDCLTCCQTWAV